MSVDLTIYGKTGLDKKPHTYTSPIIEGDYSHDAKSLKTGAHTWVIIYEDKNYRGMSKLIGPNMSYSDLSKETFKTPKNGAKTGKTKDFENFKSFQLFDYAPIDTPSITNLFISSYDNELNKDWGTDGASDQNTYQLEFDAQGCRYKVHSPIITQGKDSKGVSCGIYKVHLKNIVGGNDDEATVQFSMNTDGELVNQITIDYLAHPNVIPQWRIDAIDAKIEDAANGIKGMGDAIADGIVEGISEGEGTPVIPIVNDAFNATVDLAALQLTYTLDQINSLIKLVAKIKEKDGSLLYFPSVVAHAVIRIISAHLTVTKSDLLQSNSPLVIHKNRIPASLGANAWDDNKACSFMANGNNYSIHQPDVSLSASALNLMCSTKMDGEDHNHLALDTLFNSNGKLSAIQGSIYVHDSANDDDYKAPESGIITYRQFETTEGGETTTSTQIVRIKRADPDSGIQVILGSDSDPNIEISEVQTSLQDAYSYYLINELKAALDTTIPNNLYNMVDSSCVVANAFEDNINPQPNS